MHQSRASQPSRGFPTVPHNILHLIDEQSSDRGVLRDFSEPTDSWGRNITGIPSWALWIILLFQTHRKKYKLSFLRITLTDQEVHCVHMYCVACILDDSLMVQELDYTTFNFPRNPAFVDYSHGSPLKEESLSSHFWYTLSPLIRPINALIPTTFHKYSEILSLQTHCA